MSPGMRRSPPARTAFARIVRARAAHARVARVVAGLAAVLVAACGSDGDPPLGPGQIFPGTYTLRSVNGVAPPVTVYADTAMKVEALEGAITLNGDGTWSSRETYRTTYTSGTVTTETPVNVGRFTVSGSDIILTDPNGRRPVSASYDGRTLTHVGAGRTWIYRR
jgi:hypothetical protein